MSYPSTPPGAYQPSSYQIDVVEQVVRAFRAVTDNAQLIGEIALLPYLIVLGIELVGLISGGLFAWLVAPARAVGSLVFGTVFIVRWHRFVLLGETIGGGLLPRGWGPFIIATIKLFVAVIAGSIPLLLLTFVPPLFLSKLLAMLGGFVLALLALRVSLIFPAAAIEQPVDLQTAWNWMSGNFWRLFAAALACYLPFAVAEIVIGWVATIFPSIAWIVFEALRLAVSFVGAAVIAALLSHIYRDMGRNNAAAWA
jgi:hypothetical protein